MRQAESKLELSGKGEHGFGKKSTGAESARFFPLQFPKRPYPGGGRIVIDCCSKFGLLLVSCPKK